MQTHDQLIPIQSRNCDIFVIVHPCETFPVQVSSSGVSATEGLFKGSLPLWHRRPCQQHDRTAGGLTVWITRDRFSPCREVLLLLPNLEPHPPTARQMHGDNNVTPDDRQSCYRVSVRLWRLWRPCAHVRGYTYKLFLQCLGFRPHL